MEEVPISAVTLAGLAFAALVNLLLPFVLWFVWRRKNHASWIPLFAGVIGYLLIGLIRGMARTLLLSGMRDTPWVYYILQAVFAGVFEEGGRYIVFRFVIPNRDHYRDAVSYGIGHGGLESVLVNSGGVLLFYFLVGWIYMTQGTDGLAAQGMDMEGVPELLQQIAGITLPFSLFRALSGVSAMALHICMSVLVFTAVHYAPDRRWLFAAVGLHTLADVLPAFYFTGNLSETGVNIAELLYMAAVIYLTCRVYEIHRRRFAEELLS